MTHHTIIQRFKHAIAWNSAGYALYKMASTFITFRLYMVMSSHDFATLANIMSITFLILLWLDCGLRKSLPYYSLMFHTTRTRHTMFITRVVVFQSALVCLAAATLYILPCALTSLIYRSDDRSLILYALVLLVTEGMTNIAKLLFHAHGWYRSFYTITLITLSANTAMDLASIYILPPSHLIHALLMSKIMCTICSLLALARSFTYYKNRYIYHDTHHATPCAPFMQHASIMALTSNLKSLSERNVLIPLLIATAGEHTANVYKVANDTALLFYRTILKTIGSSDTTLLTEINTSDNAQELMPQALITLITTICTYCIPFALLVLSASWYYSNSTNTIPTAITAIIVISYVIEAIMLPCERLLEIRQEYRLLARAHVPYTLGIGITLCLCQSMFNTYGFIASIAIIHALRLSIPALTTYYAYWYYRNWMPSVKSIQKEIVYKQT